MGRHFSGWLSLISIVSQAGERKKVKKKGRGEGEREQEGERRKNGEKNEK